MKNLKKIASVLVVALIAMLAVTSCSKKETVVTPFYTVVGIGTESANNLSDGTKSALYTAINSAKYKWNPSGTSKSELEKVLYNYVLPSIKNTLTSDQIAELKTKNTQIVCVFTDYSQTTTYQRIDYYCSEL